MTPYVSIQFGFCDTALCILNSNTTNFLSLHPKFLIRGAGDNLYMNFGCVILDCAAVTLGDNILLGPNVQLYAATHPTDPQLRVEGKEMAYPITIGNNVWIGGCAIVCPGVTIGDDTTIGAGSVVTKVGSPYVIRSISRVAHFGLKFYSQKFLPCTVSGIKSQS